MISADLEELGVEELRARLSEAENNLMAIYSGEIDALLLTDESGERRVFTLRSADAPSTVLRPMNSAPLMNRNTSRYWGRSVSLCSQSMIPTHPSLDADSVMRL